jgi:hypothetical protein
MWTLLLWRFMGPTIMTDQHGVSWTRHKTLLRHDISRPLLAGFPGLSAERVGGWFAEAWAAVWFEAFARCVSWAFLVSDTLDMAGTGTSLAVID